MDEGERDGKSEVKGGGLSVGVGEGEWGRECMGVVEGEGKC